MRLLEGIDSEQGMRYIIEASRMAARSLCDDAHCGSIIVKDGEIIGQGFNSPPQGSSQKRCHIPKTAYDFKVTDKTCCIHAEVRAIMDAMRNFPERLSGARLYFIRLDDKGDMICAAGKPFCTLCSKMALDVGIAEFVLSQEEGLVAYGTDEYNELSFRFSEDRK